MAPPPQKGSRSVVSLQRSRGRERASSPKISGQSRRLPPRYAGSARKRAGSVRGREGREDTSACPFRVQTLEAFLVVGSLDHSRSISATPRPRRTVAAGRRFAGPHPRVAGARQEPRTRSTATPRAGPAAAGGMQPLRRPARSLGAPVFARGQMEVLTAIRPRAIQAGRAGADRGLRGPRRRHRGARAGPQSP